MIYMIHLVIGKTRRKDRLIDISKNSGLFIKYKSLDAMIAEDFEIKIKYEYAPQK